MAAASLGFTILWHVCAPILRILHLQGPTLIQQTDKAAVAQNLFLLSPILFISCHQRSATSFVYVDDCL